MKLDFLMLAHYAYVDGDGAYSIIRGGISTLQVPAVPWRMPNLSVAIRLVFDADDYGSQHVAEASLTHVDSGLTIWSHAIAISAAPDQGTRPSQSVPLVINIQQLTLPEAGRYRMVLGRGATVIGSAEVEVRVANIAPAPAIVDIPQVNEASGAFARGEYSKAIDILTALADAYPELAIAHNNLGFALLSQGLVKEGVPHLLRAAELHFDRPDILEMNLACADYVLGRFRAASERLRALEAGGIFEGGAFLLGVVDSRLYSAVVRNEVEYLQLGMLNHAWAELRQGNRPAVAELLRRLTSLPKSDLLMQEAVAASLSALRRAK